jgi:hypothetical protein
MENRNGKLSFVFCKRKTENRSLFFLGLQTISDNTGQKRVIASNSYPFANIRPLSLFIVIALILQTSVIAFIPYRFWGK